MATRNQMIFRRTKKPGRASPQRRGQSLKPPWRIDTEANERRASEIEAEADRETSETIRQGKREFANRIRKGRVDQDWLYDERRKEELPKLGLCKIRPERFREMSEPQLQRGLFFIGPVTMKERTSPTNPRGLVHRLISNLLSLKRVEYDWSDPADVKRFRDSYKREVERIELEIYDAQAKKSCPIATLDVAARDYIREKREAADPEVVDKIRGKRRPKIR